MNDAPDSRLETLDHWVQAPGSFQVVIFKVLPSSCLVRKAYYLKIFEKHDIEISFTAWFSHAMPLKINQSWLKVPSKCT